MSLYRENTLNAMLNFLQSVNFLRTKLPSACNNTEGQSNCRFRLAIWRKRGKVCGHRAKKRKNRATTTTTTNWIFLRDIAQPGAFTHAAP